MVWPDFVETGVITAGAAFTLENGTPLKTRIEATASRPLVSGATGVLFFSKKITVISELGEQASLTLPVTDQPGWRDGNTGDIIDVSEPDTHTHTYLVTRVLLDDKGSVMEGTLRTYNGVVVPTGSDPIDLDLMLPTETVEGAKVSIPDSWSQDIAASAELVTAAAGYASAAQTAAGQAATSAGQALEAVAPVAEQVGEVEGTVTELENLTTSGRLGEDALSATFGEQIAEAGSPARTSTDARVLAVATPRFDRQRANSFVVAGDSITEPGPIGRRFWAWANSFLYRRLNIVRNAGIGGNTSAMLLARFDADVLAYESDWVHILIGTNDPLDTADGGYTEFVSNVTQMLDKCATAGRKVVIGTIIPRKAGLTANQERARLRMNAWINALPLTRPVLVVDYSAALTDPATGLGVAGLFIQPSDNTHPGYGACALMGRALSRVLDPWLIPNAGLLDNETDPRQLLLRGRFSGAGAGATPTGWFETAWTGGTRTYSKVARTDAVYGSWQRVVVSAGGDGSLGQNRNIDASLAVGETVVAEVEYRASGLEALASGQYLTLELAAYNGTAFTTTKYDLSPGTGSENVVGFDRQGVLRTEPLVIPAGTTLVQTRIHMAGGGTYEFDRAALRKVS